MDFAEAYCQGYGGHLVSFTNEQEYDTVKSFLIIENYQDLWIGLKQNKDSIKDDLSDFAYTDGSTAGFNKFPNQVPNSNDGEQKCVVSDWAMSKWVSKDCAVKKTFICKTQATTSDFTTAYPPTTPRLTIPCDDGDPDSEWVADPSSKSNQYCYLFSQYNTLPFYSADKFCKSWGGHLVSIHSEEENAFVVTNLQYVRKNVWIGLDSKYTGEFVWQDGSDVAYQRWSPGEPNRGDIQEDCVEIYSETGGWNDCACDSDSKPYVCKKPRNGGDVTTPKPTEAPKAGNCPLGFYKLHDYCYKLVQEPAQWPDAVDSCKRIGNGFNLASIHSAKENALIASMLYPDINAQNQVWTGGRASTDHANVYIWSDYTAVNVDFWAVGQPDRYDERCVAMYEDGNDVTLGKWSDEDCTKTLNFVCKGPASPDNDPQPPANCSIPGFESFVPYRDSCYHMGSQQSSWSDAEGECKRMGAELVSILDKSEQAGLFAVSSNDDFWIGLKDIEEKMNSAFWSDGNLLTVHNWAAFSNLDQPSCIYMNSTDGRWYPRDCSNKMNYVCKVTSDPPTTQSPDFKGYCPGGFEDAWTNGDNCYLIGSLTDYHQSTWSRSEMLCREKGANLASITSDEEATALVSYYNKAELDDKAGGLWIGLVAYRDALGLGPIWTWTDGTNATGFTKWDDGYPVNVLSTAAQCAIMSPDGPWTNTDCASYPDVKHHLCKVKKVGRAAVPPTVPTPNNVPPEKEGLSGGAKAAIVICSLLGLAGVVVGGVFLRKKNLGPIILWKRRPTAAGTSIRPVSLGGLQKTTRGTDNIAYNSN